MKTAALCGITLIFLYGCASTHPDHFYALQSQPVGTVPSQTVTTPLVLKVTLPSLVDRNELVLREGNSVIVMEHERWAAPLADQVTAVLGQDLEERRPDIMISPRLLSPGANIVVSVDIVELSASRSDGVSMEARWRVKRDGGDQSLTGRATFKQSVRGNGYLQLAHATSSCVAQLADRLVEQLAQQAH